jgi:microcystin-dependent protein
MSNPFLGSVVLFAGNFAPRGWAFCDGQLLPIAQNTALFSLLGTTYGGNGQTTFALPDLRGRHPVGPRQGPGLSNVDLGEQAGVENVTLISSQLPAHAHPLRGSNAEQNTNSPDSAIPAKGGVYVKEAGPGAEPMPTAMGPTGVTGSSQPHENRSPYLGLNYIIALQGIFPSRN